MKQLTDRLAQWLGRMLTFQLQYLAPMTVLQSLLVVILILVMSGCASTTGLSTQQVKDLGPQLTTCEALPKLQKGTAKEVLDNLAEIVRLYVRCSNQVEAVIEWQLGS